MSGGSTNEIQLAAPKVIILYEPKENDTDAMMKTRIRDERTIESHSHSHHPRKRSNSDIFLTKCYKTVFMESRQDKRLPLIQKVPPRLREVESNKTCFDPLIVSIGPIHYGKDEFKIMEELKYERAKRLLSTSSRCSDTFEDLYYMVLKIVKDNDLKARYADNNNFKDKFDDEQFAAIMFLDGCFILDFICYWLYGDHKEEEEGAKERDNSIMRDLFLLENQIPFLVLKELMRKIYIGDIKKKIDTRYEHRMWIGEEDEEELSPARTTTDDDEEQKAIRSFINQQIGTKMQKSNLNSSYEQRKPIHLLDYLRMRLEGKYRPPESEQGKYQFIHSAKELKATGTIFKSNCEHVLTQVRFQSGIIFAKCSLPSIVINSSTKSMLLNLAAYEMCPDAPLYKAVTSYICLMDELIDDADDVRVLRSKGILLNCLGSDQQLAELFNQMPNQLTPDHSIYCHVKECMASHYAKKWVRFYNSCSRNSWTSLGVAAAGVALILTFIQTFFAIYPSDKLTN